MPAAGGLALATAVRVVDGVHGHAAHRGADAFPALAASLAEFQVEVLRVAHHTDRGQALLTHAADLTGAQLDLCVARVPACQGHRGTRAAGHLAALARL